MGRRGNGVEYVDINREERDGEKRKWGGIRGQKQGGKRWVEEEMGWNMYTETGRKEMGRRENGVEYVDINREERDGEKRKWGGIRRHKHGGKIWGEEEMGWNT